jgi:hypothetical protein
MVRILQANGWRITHDPFHVRVGRRNLFVDLGAERLIAAELDGNRIAVEVKTFEGPSEVHDLEVALGQYMLYDPFIRAKEPDRQLHLAVPLPALQNLFEEPLGLGLLSAYKLRLIVFDPALEEITQWIPKR